MQEAIYLAGPTASGKSGVALELARRLGGEIISVDSMQVYRGLDLGTAKPTPAERRLVPHHLLDVAEISEPFDAARFLQIARAAEDDIRARGKIPIFCGGTGLYFNALVGGLSRDAPPDPILRAELERAPLETLLQELRAQAPETLSRLDQKNPRRVIRAVEILRSGSARPDWKFAQPQGVWIGLARDRADLHQRIERRVDEMFALGLVAETQNLLARGLRENRTALQAIGYRQVAEHLSGARDLPETIALVKQKTRQYAKRQLTWFRHQLELQWLSVAPEETPSQIARKICA